MGVKTFPSPEEFPPWSKLKNYNGNWIANYESDAKDCRIFTISTAESNWNCIFKFKDDQIIKKNGKLEYIYMGRDDEIIFYPFDVKLYEKGLFRKHFVDHSEDCGEFRWQIYNPDLLREAGKVSLEEIDRVETLINYWEDQDVEYDFIEKPEFY